MSRKPHGIACPHCGDSTRIRASRALGPTYRQQTLQCCNPDCGASYSAEQHITNIISPSACPDPAVQLRQAAPRNPANDTGPNRPRGPEVPLPANDDAPPSAAKRGI